MNLIEETEIVTGEQNDANTFAFNSLSYRYFNRHEYWF